MPNEPTFRHRLEYALYRGVERFLTVFPWTTVSEVGKALGLLFWFVDARHRRIVRRNVRMSDLGLDDKGIRRLSRDCFRHYGAVFLSTIRLYAGDPEEDDRWVRTEGVEHYAAAMAEGKGVVEISAHYGNWEAMAFGFGRAGVPVYAIARSLENPHLDRALRESREAYGCRVIPKGGAIREAVRVLKKGHAVGFIMDQDALTSGIWVQFLGQWASTFPTAGNLAVRLEAPILPVFSWPTEDGGYRIRFEPAFHVPVTGDPEKDTWVASQLMSDCLERQVRRDPRWWFWMHNRFKTRPGEGNPLPSPLPDPAWVAAYEACRTSTPDTVYPRSKEPE
jgi:KDO2-lipid IV(A) lauroyltransferase